MHRTRLPASRVLREDRKAKPAPLRRRIPASLRNNQVPLGTAMSIVKGQIMDAGPLHLVGEFEIVDALGNRFPNSGIFSLCRCGHSESKPYCDGAHRAQRWSGCAAAAAPVRTETSPPAPNGHVGESNPG
ncbi:CDGSH iron-sulfur domain-containing protein [Paraburkholderia sp. NPDC080076]|uniref:CDGSH iron-sulfur domain-containing protein n=1 Tax=Paraburkholderia sp. NPDC080076 TaxID=3390605 RepID=UPI003D0029F7